MENPVTLEELQNTLIEVEGRAWSRNDVAYMLTGQDASLGRLGIKALKAGCVLMRDRGYPTPSLSVNKPQLVKIILDLATVCSARPDGIPGGTQGQQGAAQYGAAPDAAAVAQRLHKHQLAGILNTAQKKAAYREMAGMEGLTEREIVDAIRSAESLQDLDPDMLIFKIVMKRQSLEGTGGQAGVWSGAGGQAGGASMTEEQYEREQQEQENRDVDRAIRESESEHDVIQVRASGE
ncbi:hypothetical protein B484DRAFT_190882 [Ochromonadaceae sp. CCMP2298]|nr:hypothetical protein B484DRAFT_190882 [Ochromonadaceae sp. CCMP2298]